MWAIISNTSRMIPFSPQKNPLLLVFPSTLEETETGKYFTCGHVFSKWETRTQTQAEVLVPAVLILQKWLVGADTEHQGLSILPAWYLAWLKAAQDMARLLGHFCPVVGGGLWVSLVYWHKSIAEHSDRHVGGAPSLVGLNQYVSKRLSLWWSWLNQDQLTVNGN